MKSINFVVPGEPTAQGRPRFSTAGGFVKAYDPEKSRNYKTFVKCLAKEAAEKQGWEFTEKPLFVRIIAVLSIPASKSKKFKQRVNDGLEFPTKKPDVDNIFKTVTDAMSGILYKDDKQIVFANIAKTYGEQPRVEVHLEELGAEE